jgi:hypothetical protein
MKGFGGSGFGGIAIKVNSINLLSSPAYVSVTIGSEQEYVFLNWCGGDYYDGTNVWKADVAYVDGGNVYYPGAVSISTTTTPELYRYVQENNSYFATRTCVLNMPRPLLFVRSERYGSDLMYNIPLPPGNYDIMMHLAEIYFDNVGDRVFDVKINGSMELSDVDVVRDAGGAFKAHIKSLKSAAVTNGSLQIELNPKRQNAKLGDDCFRVFESDKTRSNVSLVVKSLKIRFRQSRFVHQEAICRQRQSRLRHLYRFPLQNRLHHPRRVPLPNRLSVPRLNRRSGHQLGRPLPTTADFEKDANDNTAWGSFQSRDGASDAVRMSRTGQQQYIHQGEAAPRISDDSGVDSSVFQYQDHMSESIRTFVPVLALSSQPGKFGWIRFGALLRWRYIMERNEGLSKVTRFREWRILFFCSGIQQHWRELSADFSRSYSLPLQREH